MILLTESAQNQITKLCNISNGYEIGLRIEVTSGGCSGFQYNFSMVGVVSLDESQDIIIGEEGSALFLDPVTAKKIDGSTIDYITDRMSEKFTITNTNSIPCGCGQSFT